MDDTRLRLLRHVPGWAGGVVVVVVVSYGREDDVANCLAALAHSRHASFEVAVIENAGTEAFDRLLDHLRKSSVIRSAAYGDPTAILDPARIGPEVVRHRVLRMVGGGQPVTVIEAADNLGYGGGINAALRALDQRPSWRGVWVLNPDTEPASDALSNLLAHAERGGYGLTGCRIVFRDSRKVQNRGGTWRWWMARGLGLGIGEPADAPVDVAALEARLDWISGAAMYATREFIEAVGPMDDRYFLYCEDVDWSLRRGAQRLGYAHDALVYHRHGTTIGSSIDQRARSKLSIYLTERNRLLLTRRHYALIYPLVALVCLAGLAQSYLIRGNLSGLKAGMEGWLAGIRGETGRPRFG
jgi:GT2 family glycosyltransferase